MKLVKFKDGMFGIRKGNWFSGYKFLDIRNNKFWWTIKCDYYLDCHGEEQQVRNLYSSMVDLGEVVE